MPSLEINYINKAMNTFFKSIIILLCLFNSSAEVLNYEQLLDNLRKEIHRPLYDWRIYLNADGVLSRKGRYVDPVKEYRLPNLLFYKDKSLSGKPFAKLGKDGLYINNVLACERSARKVDYDTLEGEGVAIYDIFFKPTKKTTGKSFCNGLPFYTDFFGDPDGAPYFIFNVLDLNENIGKVRIKGHTLYVDVSPFLKQPIKKPVKVMLIEKYGKEEFNKIEKDFNTIRVSYQKEDIKTLNNLFYDHCLISYRKWEEEKREKECSRKVLKRDFEFYKKIRLIKRTIYELHRADEDELEKDSIHLNSMSGERSLFIYKSGDKWLLDAITRD